MHEGLPTKKQSIENADPLKKLILSYAEYRDSDFAIRGNERTYLVDVEEGNKKISFLGVAHTNTPGDPVFTEIESVFARIQPDYVMVEGMSLTNVKKDLMRERGKRAERDAVIQHGEPLFTLKLAVESDIDFESPEPPFSEEISHLEKCGFSKKDIFSYYIYRMVYQYQREHTSITKEDCHAYQKNNIREFVIASGWDTELLQELETEIFETIDINDRDRYSRLCDPVP